MARLSPGDRIDATRRGGDLLAERDANLPEAMRWDGDRGRLDSEQTTLAGEDKTLAGERAEVNRLFADFQRRCKPDAAAPNFEACYQEIARLDASNREIDRKRGEFTKKLNAHNDAIGAFNQAVLPFAQALDAWGMKVQGLVARIESLFSAAPVPPPGKCVLLKIETNSENRVYNCKAICNRNGTHQPYEFRPFRTGKPCGVSEGDFFQDPLGGVGAAIQ